MYMCDEVCVYMCGHSEIDIKGSVYIYLCVYVHICLCVCDYGEVGMYTYM